MVSNDIVVPLVLQRRPQARAGQKDFGDFLLKVRRFAIFAIMVMAYFYYRALGNTQLAAIGLLSFAAIAQLAPAFFGGLFWRRATARGAMGGMLVGFAVWAYTLFLPSFLDGNTAGLLLLQHGPFGIEALRPQALFGADLPPLMHGVLWSLSLNVLTYVVLSLARQPSSIERLQADLFVPNALAPIAPTFRRWRTTVTVQDIQSTVAQYLGPERARSCRSRPSRPRAPHRLDPAAPADFELLQHAEHLIASSIGAASSRLVMSLLLRKRTVSAKAALKLLDDSHAALHFNREILQTALNHVRQGIAVFDADLQLICSNRQFGDILGLPPHLVQLGIPLAGNPRIHGRGRPARTSAMSDSVLERRLVAYTTEGEPYLERLPDRHMVIEVRSNRMPGGGLVITFSDVTPSFRGRRSAGARQRDAGKARAGSHRGTHPPEFRTGAGQEHRRRRQHLEDAVPGGRQPRHPAAAECSPALCHEPGRAPERRRGFAPGREHRRLAGGDRGNPRRAAGHLAARCRRDDDLDHELQDGRFDALARDRVRADRPRQGAGSGLRALLAAGANPTARCCGGCCRTSSPTRSNIPRAGGCWSAAAAAANRCRSASTTPASEFPFVKRGEIFKEFHRLEQGARIARGLGLGLSIVERLARVLNHGIAHRRQCRRRLGVSRSRCRSPRRSTIPPPSPVRRRYPRHP